MLKRGRGEDAASARAEPKVERLRQRFVLSVKSECLDRIVPLGAAHLPRAISEFVAHYHTERNHQGLDNVLLQGALTPANENGRILRRARLGGLLNFYHRNAA